MALPASPPITLQQIQAEFGAPAGTPLASFLRGGTYVPNIAANAAVPTALPISMLDLLGATNQPPVELTNQNVSALRSGAGTVSATFSMGADGIARKITNPGGTSIVSGQWCSANPADYEIRYTNLGSGGGGSISGTFGVWINGATGSSCGCTHSAGVGATNLTAYIEIRPAGGGAVIDSGTITCSAERF